MSSRRAGIRNPNSLYGRKIHRIGPKIPPVDFLVGGRAEGPDGDPAQRHRDRPPGPRLPLLRLARGGQNVVRPHFRQVNQLLKPHARGRPLQRVPLVPGLQREPLAQHHRARRRLEQRRGGYPLAHRPGADSTHGGKIPRVHHRRGPHALVGRIQRLPQNPRGAPVLCDFHPGDHREAQDYPHHPLALPNLRLRPHHRGRHHRPPGLRCRKRRGQGRARGPRGDRPQSRRGDARRAVDFRPGGGLIAGRHHI